MKQIETLIATHIRNSYPNYSIATFPSWLKKQHWKPSFFLVSKDHKKLLAIDIILSGSIPRFQYTKIVGDLLKRHKNLRVIIITLEESYENDPEIKKLCIEYKLGLKILIPDIGIQTVVKTDLDPDTKVRQLPLEDGWFPSTILNKCKGLKKLGFYRILDDFVDKVQTLGNNAQKTLKIVCTTIDQLLSCHPSFETNFGQFMKLSHFDQLLRLTDPKSSDHAFHSFRVFLVGCPVINEFYGEFRKAQKPFCKMDKRKLSIEYIWFLTSIFHDIGRPKEGAREFIQKFSETMDDVELEYSIGIPETKWKKEHNITAKRVLGSLGTFVTDGDSNEEWDGGFIDDEDSKRLSTEWINMYSEMRSHGVISAFDFLGDIFEKAMAADERKHRPFIVTHAAPAALSIMLHDWKVWEKMRELKMIPVNMSMLPMAALLIYIDTWDNYKRRGSDPLTFIKEYIVNSQGALVKIEWGDSDLMEKDKIGYMAYKKAITNLLFKLDLKYGLAGTV